MSIISDNLVSIIRQLPQEDRIPVMRSILVSAGEDLERRVLEEEARLTAQGLSPEDALSNALDTALHEPGGPNIIRVLASAAASRVVEEGLAKDRDVEVKKFEAALAKADDVQNEGLGFIATIVTAAIAVCTIAVRAIAAAVHKVRQRRRDLKARLTPLRPDEIELIVTTIAPKYSRFDSEACQTEVLDRIAEIRMGRRSYLVDPRANPPVHEYAAIRDAFVVARRQIEEQIRAAQLKQTLIVGGGIAAVTLVSVVVIKQARSKIGSR